MIIDHASFDIMCLPDWSVNFYELDGGFLVSLQRFVEDFWWFGNLRMVLRLSVVCIFFALSGISSSFSRNNALRGLKLAVASVVLSLFTVLGDTFFDMGISIIFGVLHCFTVSILIYALLEFMLKDKAIFACVGLGILLFIWGLLLDFYNLQYHSYVYPPYSFTDILRLAVGTAYTGADCFGIMPYTGIFLIGVAGGKLLYRERKAYLPLFGKKPFAPVCFVGRHAVWFYLLHQPVIFVIVVFVGAFFGLKFF